MVAYSLAGTSGWRRVTFTWESGFALGPSQNAPCNQTSSVEIGADYRGDELVVANLEQTIVCFPSEPSVTSELVVDSFRLPLSTAGVNRSLQYLDLRTPSPTVVFHESFGQTQPGCGLVAAGWAVDGVVEDLTGPVESCGFDDPTVATDALGRVLLDWRTFLLARLHPPGDVLDLAGAVGPVGVF